MTGFDWDADLTVEEREQLVEDLAQKVHKRQLYAPAILFLEMHKPVAYLASQSLILGSGFLAPLFGPKNVQQISKLFEKRENIELLVRRIEELQAPEKETAADGTR